MIYSYEVDLSTIPATAKLREDAITELQKYITQCGIGQQTYYRSGHLFINFQSSHTTRTTHTLPTTTSAPPDKIKLGVLLGRKLREHLYFVTAYRTLRLRRTPINYTLYYDVESPYFMCKHTMGRIFQKFCREVLFNHALMIIYLYDYNPIAKQIILTVGVYSNKYEIPKQFFVPFKSGNLRVVLKNAVID
jgi:hypothetical protein